MTTRNRFSAFDDPFFDQSRGLNAETPTNLGQPSQRLGSPFGGGFTFEQPTPLNQPRGLSFEQPTQLAGQTPNVFQDFLEEEPNLAFQSALQRENLTPNQLQFFQNDRKRFFDRFEGLLGQQIQSGQVPNLRFADFIGDVDFNREFQLTPQNRRPGGVVNPRTTFLR